MRIDPRRPAPDHEAYGTRYKRTKLQELDLLKSGEIQENHLPAAMVLLSTEKKTGSAVYRGKNQSFSAQTV